MTMIEKNKRQSALLLANSVTLIEGVPVSQIAETIYKKWATGEITATDMKAMLLAKHKQPALVSTDE